MKQYQYNYSYLEKWMEANPHITNREIMQSFTGNVNNNNSLALYAQRKTPMPIINLLRFCNTFGVPISAFIVETGEEDKKGNDECAIRVEPSINDQMEPDGGYISVGERRPHGSRALRNPLEVEHIKSAVPGLVKQPKPMNNDSNIIHQNHNEGNNIQQHINKAQAVVGNIAEASKGDNDNAITSRLLDIIAEQQKQIASLSQQVGELAGQVVKLSSERMSKNNDNSMNACMVAEDSPRHRQ